MGTQQDTMWDDEDGFFYDVLRLPDGYAFRMKVRSMVGLLPLAAVAIFEDDALQKMQNFRKRAKEFMMRHPELEENLHMPETPGLAGRRMLSTVNEDKLRRILSKMRMRMSSLGHMGYARYRATTWNTRSCSA